MKIPPIYRKLLMSAVLVACFDFPQTQIEALIDDRRDRQRQSEQSVLDDWGRSLEVRGPFVAVQVAKKLDQKTDWEVSGRVYTVPEEMDVTVDLPVEERYRGIFKTSVYQAEVVLNGTFSVRSVLAANAWSESGAALPKGYELRADDAWLHLLVSDKNGLLSPGTAEVAGESAVMELTEASELPLYETGLAVQIPAKVLAIGSADRVPFKIKLQIKGSQSFKITPFALRTTASIKSNWAHPSFLTGWLPTKRTVTKDGFQASFAGANARKILASGEIHRRPDFWRKAIAGFGVELAAPLSPYQPIKRAVKFGMLFVLLTFASLLLFEVLAGLRLHFIQYVSIGAALALFFLLLLSLSERIPFLAAYVAASSAIVFLVGGYASSILKSLRRAGIVTGGLMGLYTYLYVLLMLESESLIFGSVGLFLLLAAFMYGTRKIDWYHACERAVPGKSNKAEGLPQSAGS